tara:strand:+ start:12284 stop:12556 length:273 start_codon:yes stop_codon:yes gene_type:complete
MMKETSKQSRKASFRIDKVRGDLRGKVWYLTCHENGKRLPQIGPDKEQAWQMTRPFNPQQEAHTNTVFIFCDRLGECMFKARKHTVRVKN